MVKGEHHQVYNNMAFGNKDRDIRILDDSHVGGGANKGSVTANNIEESISGDRNLGKPVRGRFLNNFDAKENGDLVLDQSRDPVSRDF